MTAAFAAAALLLIGGSITAPADTSPQEPALTVHEVPDSAHKALLRIDGLLADPALEDATRSGLPLRIRVRIELWKDGWIDNLVASEMWSAVLLYEPLAREYIVRGNPSHGVARRFPSYATARAALEREYMTSIGPRARGNFYYTATLELETLSLSDLEELERWLQGELQPAVSGDRSLTGAMGQGAKRLMIRLLGLPTRRLEARSNRFTVS